MSKYKTIRVSKEQHDKKVKRNKKDLYILIAVIVISLLFLFGASYAVFNLVISGTKQLSVTSGELKIDFEDTSTISLNNAYPVSDQEGLNQRSYDFTVSNNGTINAIYDISLEEKEVTKDTLNKRYIKYSIKEDDGVWSNPIILEELNSLLLDQNKTIKVGEKKNYSIKLWIDENAGNDAQNKVFEARIVVNSTQENAKPKDIVSPIIKLAGSLSMNINKNTTFTDPGVLEVTDDKDVISKDKVVISYEYYDKTNTTIVESIDTNKLGIYYIYYKVSDTNNNEGVVVRTININEEDKTTPVITLNGSSTIEINQGDTYSDLGAKATDIEDGDITSKIITVGTVNTEKPGTYTVKYIVTDSNGNTSSIARVVIVKEVDKIGPTVTFRETNISKGNNNWYKNVGLEIEVNDNRGIKSTKYCETTTTCTPNSTLVLSDKNTHDYSFTGKNLPQKICIEAEDVTSNKTTKCSEMYQVDGIEPKVSNLVLTPDDATLLVEVTGADLESTVEKYYYSKDGGKTYVTSTNSNYTFTSLEEGDYLVVVYIEDKAGNISGTKVASSTVRHKSFCEKNGLTNFGDCVIATEEKEPNIVLAKNKIEAKTKPDFTKTSPSITYEEVVSPSTSSNSHTYYSYIGTGYTFNKTTGRYALTGHSLKDPTTVDYKTGNYYTCLSTSQNCPTMYKITGASSSTNQTTGTVTYTMTKYDYTQNPVNYNTSDTGMYSLNDNDGTSYYFRGAVGGNYVKFGGFYWRILRVNGDGSLRLIYDGTSAHANGSATSNRQIGTSAFNTYWSDNTYVGYMYGDHTKFQVTDSGSKTFGNAGLSPTTKYAFGTSYTFDQVSRTFKLAGTITMKVPSADTVGLYTCISTSTTGTCPRMNKITRFNNTTNLQIQAIEYNSTTKELAHQNVNNSNVKTYLENWYNTKLLSYESKISKDTTYCNDRSVSQYANVIFENQGYGINPTMYNYTRFYNYAGSTIGKPQLTCANRNDMFSVTPTKGNALMKYPIGLLTMDEANLAGGRAGYINTLYYLYSGTSYWTMSPARFNDWFIAENFYVNFTGEFSTHHMSNGFGVRPVINLKSDNLTFIGSGTMNDPYIVS